MMKNTFLFFLLTFTFCSAFAQDSSSIKAKAFIRQGDYSNAIMVLNRAIGAGNTDISLQKDLAFAYYLSRDYTKALAAARPVTESKDADVQSYQILGMVYKAIEEKKEAEKMYRSGLKKFPESGALYNETGEVVAARGEPGDAIRLWLKGIQVDPNYSGNYYNAAKFYFSSADNVWGLLYGEIFVNLESYSKRTPEIKTLLLEGYKKLFSDADLNKNQDNRNGFVKAFLDVMKNQAEVVNSGVSPDALAALRTRFILEWFDKYASRFPFRLFDYHRQLAKEGMFDAYNQWIFGAASDLPAFQQWSANHGEEYNKFNHFQKNRVFKLPEGQYYQRR